MRIQTHLLNSKEFDGLPSYPQATRGECSNCSFVFRSYQHE
jgi:hypothetical protein